MAFGEARAQDLVFSRETCGYEPCDVLERSNITEVHCTSGVETNQH
jgi:hypothetical protein